jgi:iron-sulfur cluster repair protein YtfE (RIC family)
MRATRLLEAQHQKVTSLINRLLRRNTGRERLVMKLADALAAHMLIEEEILYPVARSIEASVVDHAVAEHDMVAIAMQRVLATPTNTREFEVRLQTLRTLLEHHVTLEENALLPTLEQHLTSPQSATLRRVLKARFDDVLPAGSQKILSMRRTRITCPAAGAIRRPAGRKGKKGHR